MENHLWKVWVNNQGGEDEVVTRKLLRGDIDGSRLGKNVISY